MSSHTRRGHIALWLGIFSSPFATSARACEGGHPLPPRKSFASGDLLWTKLPYEIVPYAAEAHHVAEQAEWKRQLARYLDQLATSPHDLRTEQIAAKLARMSYDDYVTAFSSGVELVTDTRTQLYGSGIPGTGHVGIVDIDSSGAISVVDASIGRGVARTNYDKWLSDQACNDVWHGRIACCDVGQREAIVRAAREHLGKKYNFFGFNLRDATDFYCSKLVWLSAFNSVGIAVDGDPNPLRHLWLSPKQLLASKQVQILYRPGKY